MFVHELQKRTSNILFMPVTLEVSKLSGWLKASALCWRRITWIQHGVGGSQVNSRVVRRGYGKVELQASLLRTSLLNVECTRGVERIAHCAAGRVCCGAELACETESRMSRCGRQRARECAKRTSNIS